MGLRSKIPSKPMAEFGASAKEAFGKMKEEFKDGVVQDMVAYANRLDWRQSQDSRQGKS